MQLYLHDISLYGMAEEMGAIYISARTTMPSLVAFP
jgi:hypothetical protein